MKEMIQKPNEETFKKDKWKATELPKVNGFVTYTNALSYRYNYSSTYILCVI